MEKIIIEHVDCVGITLDKIEFCPQKLSGTFPKLVAIVVFQIRY
jgi:hypothetical protein